MIAHLAPIARMAFPKRRSAPHQLIGVCFPRLNFSAGWSRASGQPCSQCTSPDIEAGRSYNASYSAHIPTVVGRRKAKETQDQGSSKQRERKSKKKKDRTNRQRETQNKIEPRVSFKSIFRVPPQPCRPNKVQQRYTGQLWNPSFSQLPLFPRITCLSPVPASTPARTPAKPNKNPGGALDRGSRRRLCSDIRTYSLVLYLDRWSREAAVCAARGYFGASEALWNTA